MSGIASPVDELNPNRRHQCKNSPIIQWEAVFKMATTLENANPTIFLQKTEREVLPDEENEDVVDKIDKREVFDIL